MTITIPSELEAHLREKAQAAGLSIDSYVERLILEEDEWMERAEQPLQEIDPGFASIDEAVREGLDQAERGHGRKVREVFAELRAKYEISG